MKSKLLNHDGDRTYVVALETGESLIASLTRFAREERLAASEFTAIGALAWAKLAYFNWETKSYDEIPVDEQVEVLSLNGRITLPEGADVEAPSFDTDPHFHVHCVLGRGDGTTVGGHLMEIWQVWEGDQDNLTVTRVTEFTNRREALEAAGLSE